MKFHVVSIQGMLVLGLDLSLKANFAEHKSKGLFMLLHILS